MGQCANVRYLDRIPAKGMFVVGADVVPGRYVCRTPGNGRWIRYPGGNGAPVAGRPDTPGEAEVVIESGDVAFQTHMPGDWLRVGAPGTEDSTTAGSARWSTPTSTPISPPGCGPGPTCCATSAPARRGRASGRGRTAATGCASPCSPCSPSSCSAARPAWTSPRWSSSSSPPPGPPGTACGSACGTAGSARCTEAAKANPDRFCLPGDLDENGRALLARAQEAIRRVRESEVARAGLLEPGENAVTLPRQEWQIAKTLRKVAQLREDQRRLLAEEVTPQAEEALRPLRKALDDVEASVAARVEALERYAERTAEADAAYRAHAQVARVADRAAEYQDLLAETVADELAVAEIDRLARNAAELKKALQESLQAAQQAAVELPRPDEP